MSKNGPLSCGCCIAQIFLSGDAAVLTTPTCMAIRNQRYRVKCVGDNPCASILLKINGARSMRMAIRSRWKDCMSRYPQLNERLFGYEDVAV